MRLSACARVVGVLSDGAEHAVRLAGVEVWAADSRVQLLEGVDRETPAAREAGAGGACIGGRGEVAFDCAAGEGEGVAGSNNV